MPLYPEISNPISYEFDVDSPHRIYVEECGNPKGIPVIFLHGGPGSGCNLNHRRYFNSDEYRIILFDQRGCGRSKPHGCLDKNTTHHLIDDMEVIRSKLNIDQWVVFAGSWGSTLALLYAQQFRQNVLAMILRGSFLASKRDMDWFFKDGVSRLFPELWQRFSSSLPKLNSDETLLQTYHRCLFTEGSKEDKELNKKAALAWVEWTDSIVTWRLPSAENKAIDDIDKLIRKVRLELHYAKNQYFLETDHLLNNMDKIQGIPTTIIHGRRDITCPVESSWRIHTALASSSLKILPNAGHLADEPDMVEALVSASDDVITMLKNTN